MKNLANYIQQNPLVVLLLVIVSILGNAVTISLGWGDFYTKFLSQDFSVPYWVAIIIFIGITIVIVKAKTSKDDIFEEGIKLEIVDGKRFGTERVILDGKHFLNCMFHNTEVVYNGLKNTAIEHCTFRNPTFVFDKSAANTMSTLVALYADPTFRPIVEITLENIKKGHTPPPPPVSRKA